MTVEEWGILGGVFLGIIGFIWNVLSWIWKTVRNKPIEEATTYQSLSSSIAQINNTVKTQGEIIDQLVQDIIEKDTLIKAMKDEITMLALERDRLLQRIEYLESQFTIRDEEYQRVMLRLKEVERERDKLKIRVDHLEEENTKLKEAFGSKKL